jgi:hypothetical protein
MAEEVMDSAEAEGGTGVVGTAIGAIGAVFNYVATTVYNLVSGGDRAVAAAWRQGLDELGTAFGKALPDSMQIDESGSLWNPTQGEIASAATETSIYRSYDGPTPGEIAERNKPYVAEQDQGVDQDEEQDFGY